MEAAVRHLRTARSPSGNEAQLLLIQDTLQALGGHSILCKVLAKLCLLPAQAKSESSHVLLLALEHSPQQYAQMLGKAYRPMLQIVDGFSDPFAWHKHAAGERQAVAWRVGKGLAGLWQALQQQIANRSQPATNGTAAQPAPYYVAIDSLDHMLQHASLAEVLTFLQGLSQQSGISGISAKIHEDLHPAQVLSALATLCTVSLQLQPLQGLRKDLAAQNAPSKQAPHGELQLHLKRHTGRVKVETDFYTLLSNGELDMFAPPLEVITAQLLAAKAVQSGGEHIQGPAAQVDLVTIDSGAHEALLTNQAGMKLTLTDQERRARQAVILPYEHQGSGRIYQTGDFRDYLPHAAGGQGKGTGEGALGHILYVRDSESEHDSDEDPDDDLDI